MTMIPTYLAYNSEGLGNLYDWHMVKNYQMKNGYVFNSPSATAAVFINHQDVGCLNYLNSLWTSLVIQVRVSYLAIYQSQSQQLILY
ncbi:putative ent-kaurene synthase [Helianthus annuus]|nr:putative ent-kaurene synthase [Helianthus annuus]